MSTFISKHLQTEYDFDAWVITCEIDDDDMPQNEKQICEKSAIEYVKFRGFDVKRYSEGFSFQVVDRNSTKIEDAILHHISNDTGLSPELFLHAWKTTKSHSRHSESSETSSEASVNMFAASTSSGIFSRQAPTPSEYKVVTFGKNCGQLYKNVFENDKPYVQWVLELKECTGKMLDLQQYFKKPYECSECKKNYKTKHSLYNHRALGRCRPKLEGA
jgi:hypothetical protein